MESDANLNQTTGHPAIGLNPTTHDQANTDAILRTFFNDGLSNTALSWNDNVLTGINWADILNANSSNTFEEAPTLTPASPLRITDVHHRIEPPARTTPTVQPGKDSCHQLINDTQQQSDGIQGVADRMDSLEAAIERLVGSLPETMEALPLDLGSNETADEQHSSRTPFGESQDVEPEGVLRPRRGEFDTDAFLRTLISSTDSDQNHALVTTTDLRYPRADPGLVRPGGHIPNNSPTMVKELVERPRSREGLLDLDRILDEWTCEEGGGRMPPSGFTPIPTPALELNENEARTNSSKYLGERSVADSPSTVSSAERSIDSGSTPNPGLVIDLSDDDHLRRLMSKKSTGLMIREDDSHPDRDRLNVTPLPSVGEGGTQVGPTRSYSTQSAAVPTTNLSIDHFHHHGFDHPTPQSEGTTSSHLYKSNEALIELLKHHSSRKRYLEEMNGHHPNLGRIGNYPQDSTRSSIPIDHDSHPSRSHHPCLSNEPLTNSNSHKKTRR